MSQTIRIGIGPTESLLLRKPLKLFHEKFPHIMIDLTTYTYPVLLTRYRNGVLDLAICNDLCADEMDSFILEPIYTSPWHIAAGKDHSFWSLPREQQITLDNQVIITLLQNAYDAVHTFCEQNISRPHSFLITNFLCTQLEMLQANLGIALLPPFIKDSLPDCVRMEDILETPFAPTFYAAYNPETITPEIQELISLCKQENA